VSNRHNFEATFRDFVRVFGGEVLAEHSNTKVADFLFRKRGIVAELKCLEVDQTVSMNNKVAEVVKDAAARNENLLSLCDGNPLAIATAPKEIADAWLRILTTPLEGLVRDANRQIRSTKEEFNLPFAKGLLLVFNQNNLLHNSPQDFKLLLAAVLSKKTNTKQLRFNNIHGVVYFSFESVKARPHGMSFWAPMLLRLVPDEDVKPMQQFQSDLRQGWYAYIEKLTGRKVRQHAGG
jgi:hypothetical protein